MAPRLDCTYQCVCGSHWLHGSSLSGEYCAWPTHLSSDSKLSGVSYPGEALEKQDCLSPEREGDQFLITQQITDQIIAEL